MDYQEGLRNLSGQVKILSYKHVAIGPYSTIYRGTLISTNELVAIKLMHSIDGVTLHTIRRKIEREGRTWSMLQHPNILPLYGFVDGDEDDEFFQPFGAFISPLRQRGDLAQYLHQCGDGAPLHERLKLWADVVAGVAYLHVNNPILIHGDLKPRNILIDDSGNAQICDFGLVRVYLEEGSTGTTTTTAHTGTDRYLAYELVMGKEHSVPTTASDIYATGCIGLEVIFQEMPYAYSGPNFRWYMLQAMQDGIPPAVCPGDLPLYLTPLWKIMSQCWTRDPRSRPHARTLSLHVQEILRTLDTKETAQLDSDSMIDTNWATRVMRSGIWGGSEGGSVEDHLSEDMTGSLGPEIPGSQDFPIPPTPVTPTMANMVPLHQSLPPTMATNTGGAASPALERDEIKSIYTAASNVSLLDTVSQGVPEKQPRKSSRSLFAQLTTLGTNYGSGEDTDMLKVVASTKGTGQSSSTTTRVREFSVVVMGPGDVGKSGVVLRFVRGSFLEAYDPTIEESYTQTVTVDGETSTLEILNTAGTEQFVSLNELYIKSGKGFMLVFSLKDETTLIEIKHLIEQIARIKGNKAPIVAVGTYLDLADERQVSREMLETVSRLWGVPIYEVSVKRNWNITDAFHDLLRQMRVQYPEVIRSSGRKRKVPSIWSR